MNSEWIDFGWQIPDENRNHQWDDLNAELELHDCGYREDTFACRIRHIHMNTGACKAAND